ncbi:recombinase family protein [Paraburkholderia sp. Ac-20347]|uniref:recombinase family protein n=1 Tax=Paraburkholderia sp. Ac-20347 TaxID=2703892 RepID=UPI00197DC8CC|nr:recombinase family protein [Paraburkholderia sp. Ac-20347]MBN3813650.1 recombinase family protein [Paraburkholderia sp. Ac-20347]
MSRTFVYARVSTEGQTPENQVHEIEGKQFEVEPHRIITEVISGSVAATERPGFAKLLDRLEKGDQLVVTKLDRLGRNAMDVRATVERLKSAGVKVVCLQLGEMDLTSPAGKLTMGVLIHIAEFERDLLIERTQAGLERARAEGKTLGRPSALSDEDQAAVRERLAKGEAVAALAREFSTSRQTIMRVRDAATE